MTPPTPLPMPPQFVPGRCGRCAKILPENAAFCPRCGSQARPIATPAESLTDDADFLGDDDAPEGAPPRQAQFATTNALKYVLKTRRMQRARENPSMSVPPALPPLPVSRSLPILGYSSFTSPPPPPRPAKPPAKKSNWPLWLAVILMVQMLVSLASSNRSRSPTYPPPQIPTVSPKILPGYRGPGQPRVIPPRPSFPNSTRPAS